MKTKYENWYETAVWFHTVFMPPDIDPDPYDRFGRDIPGVGGGGGDHGGDRKLDMDMDILCETCWRYPVSKLGGWPQAVPAPRIPGGVIGYNHPDRDISAKMAVSDFGPGPRSPAPGPRPKAPGSGPGGPGLGLWPKPRIGYNHSYRDPTEISR